MSRKPDFRHGRKVIVLARQRERDGTERVETETRRDRGVGTGASGRSPMTHETLQIEKRATVATRAARKCGLEALRVDQAIA